MKQLVNGDSLFAVFTPLYVFFGVLFALVMVVYLWYAICSVRFRNLLLIVKFMYAKSALWIGCYIIGIPLIFLNLLLFFGAPLLVCIIFPIQKVL